MAGKPRRYKLLRESVSGKVLDWVVTSREFEKGTGEYEPPKGTSRKREDSTIPLDSTRYFETVQGIKTYSEVAEILTVSVAKTIEALLTKKSGRYKYYTLNGFASFITISQALFPCLAGRLRSVNVVVGTHATASL